MNRKANYELLRIAAMVMIIGLHYLDKGGVLPKLNTELSAAGVLAWLIEAFFLMSVNAYVLLSGYFGVNAEYKPVKAISLWLQIFFYSTGIAALCVLTGVVSLSELTVYQLLGYCFPIVTEQYWFATAYLILFFLMPFLNAGAAKLDKRSFQRVLGGLLLFTCIAKTVLPMRLPTDKAGYDALWFAVVYLVGAYLKKYEKDGWKKRGFLLFGVSGLAMFLMTMCLHLLWSRVGILEEFQGYAYSYNHILCLSGAVGLFLGFGTISVSGERMRRWIGTISGGTFGVYLIHEHVNLRYLWPRWFGTARFAGRLTFIPHMFVTVFLVFAGGIMMESIRKRLFAFVGATCKRDKTV